ncbi:MAG: cysteine desulfurase [Betaproteobacteria bacterium]|nr:cysteine desulfurase [Betaproteobacteria bacterium]MBU6513210.1 cysteine desulfurase [Betaproteobacteria bacterium]MDE1955036.1 cysteine desulfurase [Betaproteobacteria bacterium]MDE2153358.1 cysteine desulfurase [Betaproteobacteria bacterium]MDE2477832.1 cysteine desulfurase [Betaproteobacteria bacterium]
MNPRDLPAALPGAAAAASFPALAQTVHGQRLVYLDGAASTLTPRCVIEAIAHYQSFDHANVHRGVHALAERATTRFEDAREAVRAFVHASATREIIFTRGATEALNLAAIGLGAGLRPGDEVIVTALEHHANLVPWQMACARSGARLRFIPVRDDGLLDVGAFESLLGPRSRVLALTQVSNVLGTVVDVAALLARARAAGLVTVVDGAQAVAHAEVDVQALGCDFYAFSAHKMYGPTGIGVLYGRESVLERIPPLFGGGDMIETVTLESATYAALPARLEAGTPNISGAVGLHAAIAFLERFDRARLLQAEHQLLAAMERGLSALPGVRVLAAGTPKQGALSFVVDGVHAHDVGTVLDRRGIAVRVGHHCAMPVMQRFGVPATVRASLSVHNTLEDVQALLDGVRETCERLR